MPEVSAHRGIRSKSESRMEIVDRLSLVIIAMISNQDMAYRSHFKWSDP
jgi:hypothetical protein